MVRVEDSEYSIFLFSFIVISATTLPSLVLVVSPTVAAGPMNERRPNAVCSHRIINVELIEQLNISMSCGQLGCGFWNSTDTS